MLKASPDLLRLVKAPVFSRDEQKKGLTALGRQMGVNNSQGASSFCSRQAPLSC